MTQTSCDEMQLILQAELDDELDASQAAAMAVHVESCPACAETQAQLAAISARLRSELTYHRAPAALHDAVRARIAASRPSTSAEFPRPAPTTRPTAANDTAANDNVWRRLRRAGLPFASGLVAAGLAVMLILPRTGDLPGDVVAGHIRALQPGHLTDVISTDQHTVKPWFDGRLDYAPPVRDFASDGFALLGGRLDYLAGRPVAALVYGRLQHSIDLFVWPASGAANASPESGSRNGYNFVRWSQGDMVFWAVSDLNATELGDFVSLWRTGPPPATAPSGTTPASPTARRPPA